MMFLQNSEHGLRNPIFFKNRISKLEKASNYSGQPQGIAPTSEDFRLY
ncbi:MAG: hypothetical protein KAI83_05225 [Thiomargarita sp.]|nr:hypothetical protein [Thiomargarita sp.]